MDVYITTFEDLFNDLPHFHTSLSFKQTHFPIPKTFMFSFVIGICLHFLCFILFFYNIKFTNIKYKKKLNKKHKGLNIHHKTKAYNEGAQHI